MKLDGKPKTSCTECTVWGASSHVPLIVCATQVALQDSSKSLACRGLAPFISESLAGNGLTCVKCGLLICACKLVIHCPRSAHIFMIITRSQYASQRTLPSLAPTLPNCLALLTCTLAFLSVQTNLTALQWAMT